MSCGDCSPIRCSAVPDTDWSAFTWRWQSNMAGLFEYTGGADGSPVQFTRQLLANDRSMFHPGVCNCLWLVPLHDQFVQLPENYVFQSPAIGALQRIDQSMVLTISRWFWSRSSSYWADDRWQEWDWQDALSDQCGYTGGGYAGWTPYGWNGWGWAYGWGWGWGFYAGAFSLQAKYQLEGSKMLSDGSDNVFTLTSFRANSEDELYNPDGWDDPEYWPAEVTLSRVAK